MEKNIPDLPINECIDELLKTRIIQYIAIRNNENFAQRLVAWLIRYILIVSSMSESLDINLEEVLYYINGNKYKEILEITENIFKRASQNKENIN
jgi:hypothetical protein